MSDQPDSDVETPADPPKAEQPQEAVTQQAPPPPSGTPPVPQLFPIPPPGRPPGQAEEEESEPAEEEERHPVVAVLGALVILAALGVSAFLLIRPLPCDHAGYFSSPTLGYCVQVPDGWTAFRDQGQGEAADRITQNGGPATIAVQAVQVPSGGTLDSVAGQVRQVDQNSGFQVTDLSSTTVGGAAAKTWTATPSGGSLGTVETVVVKDGSAWRITFSDETASLPTDGQVFNQIIGTWRFK